MKSRYWQTQLRTWGSKIFLAVFSNVMKDLWICNEENVYITWKKTKDQGRFYTSWGSALVFQECLQMLLMFIWKKNYIIDFLHWTWAPLPPRPYMDSDISVWRGDVLRVHLYHFIFFSIYKDQEISVSLVFIAGNKRDYYDINYKILSQLYLNNRLATILISSNIFWHHFIQT